MDSSKNYKVDTSGIIKGKVAKGVKISALPGFSPGERCPLCQGLAASTGKRWPPSARVGRGGSAWRGGRKVKGGDLQEERCGCPSLRSLGSLLLLLGPIASEAPPTTNPHPHSVRQPHTYIHTLDR